MSSAVTNEEGKKYPNICRGLLFTAGAGFPWVFLPFADVITAKMGTERSSDFTAEEQKGFTRWLYTRGAEIDPVSKRWLGKRAGRRLGSNGQQVKEVDVGGDEQGRVKSKGDTRNDRSVLEVGVLAWGGRRKQPQGLGDGADVIAGVPAKQENLSSCFKSMVQGSADPGEREIPVIGVHSQGVKGLGRKKE